MTPDDQASLLRTANDFLRLWLAEHNIDSAITHIDLTGLTAQFSGDDRLASPSAVKDWCRKFLTIQLVDDHSAVNRAGHGDPRHPRYGELPTRPPTEGEFRATRKADAPVLGGRDVLFTDMLGDTAFALVLRNEDAVRDSMTLVWHRTERGWSIVRLFAVAD